MILSFLIFSYSVRNSTTKQLLVRLNYLPVFFQGNQDIIIYIILYMQCKYYILKSKCIIIIQYIRMLQSLQIILFIYLHLLPQLIKQDNNQNLIIQIQLQSFDSNMHNIFQRDSLSQEPQNVNSSNIRNRNSHTHGEQKQFQTYPATNQSDQLQKLLQQIGSQVEKVINCIDKFNQKIQKAQDDFQEMEAMFAKYVRSQIHPISCSNVGDALLKNGKFVVCFIELISRTQKRDFLKLYLYNYFSELNNISTLKDYFEVYRSNLLNKQIENKENRFKEQRSVANDSKRKLLLSPESSQNDINWSTKVQRDTNSDKSGYIQSSNRNNSDKKLKKQFIRVHQQVNQQNQRSEKAQKNIKKSNTKRTKPTKVKGDRQNLSKRKKENQGKRTIPKSQKKIETKSIQDVIYTNIKSKKQEEQAQSKLGTYYHYQINLNRKNQRSLNQVRRSARLSHNKQRNSIQSRKKSLRKSSAKKSASKSKNKDNKKTKKRVDEAQQDGDSGSLYTAESEQSEDSVIQIEWIKKHLKQINIKDVQLYDDFKALTKNDEKITKLLREMQQAEEAQQNKNTKQKRKYKKKAEVERKNNNQQNQRNQKLQQEKDDKAKEVASQANYEDNVYEQQKSRNLSELKKQYKIEQLPLTIEHVVDPDLNNHGIYALLKLGRVTLIEMGTAYAVSPLSYGSRVNRKHIKEDLQKAKILAGEYSDNIGYIPMNGHILEMIKKFRQEATKIDLTV